MKYSFTLDGVTYSKFSDRGRVVWFENLVETSTSKICLWSVLLTGFLISINTQMYV